MAASYLLEDTISIYAVEGRFEYSSNNWSGYGISSYGTDETYSQQMTMRITPTAIPSARKYSSSTTVMWLDADKECLYDRCMYYRYPTHKIQCYLHFLNLSQ
jgi:hypothetical protein